MQNGIELSEPARRRGRPPAYDRDTALAALTEAFWDHGFAATSLDMLVASTAMNRPSLYAAFGDKRAMYLAVLALYRAQAEAQLRGVLDSEASIEAAVAALLQAGLGFYAGGRHGPRGCLAVCTAATESATDPDIQAALAAVLTMMDAVIAERLRQAVEAGQLPAGFDAAARASMIGALLHSLAVRVRAGEAPERLRALAAAAVPVLLG